MDFYFWHIDLQERVASFNVCLLCSVTVNLCSQGQEEATLGSFMQGPGNVLSLWAPVWKILPGWCAGNTLHRFCPEDVFCL